MEAPGGELDQFNLELHEDLAPEAVGVRPGNILVMVRDYTTMYGLAEVLRRAIELVASKNDLLSWQRLLELPFVGLRLPAEKGPRTLTTFLLHNLSDYGRGARLEDILQRLPVNNRRMVAAKGRGDRQRREAILRREEGDIRAAVRH